MKHKIVIQEISDDKTYGNDIYVQTVEGMNVALVIKAVNGFVKETEATS